MDFLSKGTENNFVLFASFQRDENKRSSYDLSLGKY